MDKKLLERVRRQLELPDTQSDWELAGTVIEGMGRRGYWLDYMSASRGSTGAHTAIFVADAQQIISNWCNGPDGPTAILIAAADALRLRGRRKR